MVCYIQKYVIILAGIFPLTSPQPKYWGGCVPGIPGGVDASESDDSDGDGDAVTCSYRLYQYGDQCAWMRNSKFLRELENDNVDSEIVSEELRCLQDDEPPRSALKRPSLRQSPQAWI